MEAFKCSGCGSCCKRIKNVVLAIGRCRDESNRLYFPYGWDSTGRCEKLTVDNKCSVYDSRPLICNVDGMIEKFGLSKAEYYKKNAEACNKMMDIDGVPQEFRIKIKD